MRVIDRLKPALGTALCLSTMSAEHTLQGVYCHEARSIRTAQTFSVIVSVCQ